MMKRVVIATDGACRGNGKADCTSSGACLVYDMDKHEAVTSLSVIEEESTNQRGELLAMITALTYLTNIEYEMCTIITDSAYVRNAICNGWIDRWKSNG